MKKLTVDFIRKEFEKEDYKLLTTKYKNAHQKLDYVCPEGHAHSISWNNWCNKKKYRCPYCSGNAKLTIAFIKKEFEKNDYRLLTKKYKNNNQKLDYICPEGHIHSIRWSDWQQGIRCPYCVNLGKPTTNFIRNEFEKEKYKLLTTEYKNSKQKLDYVCPEGHTCAIPWSDWRYGVRCPLCYRENNRGENHPSWKGGISCEPYCEVWVEKEFKKMIKERDDYQCQNPDCWGKNGVAGRLCIHHIDYNKKNCDPSNLITLCSSCNARANYNRERHTYFYNNLINEKRLSYDI